MKDRDGLAAANRAFNLFAPSATAPAFLASPSAPSADPARSPSTSAPSSLGTPTSALNARAKSFLATARSTWFRSAVTQQPRPGRLLLRSGTTFESGPTTNRISSSGAAPCALRYMCARSICFKSVSKPMRAHVTHRLPPRSSSGARSSSLIQPALSARRQHHLLGFGPRHRMACENAREYFCFAVLALFPADEVIHRVAGEILDSLHAVLAQRHHHRCGDAGNFAKLVRNPSSLRRASCSASMRSR